MGATAYSVQGDAEKAGLAQPRGELAKGAPRCHRSCLTEAAEKRARLLEAHGDGHEASCTDQNSESTNVLVPETDPDHRPREAVGPPAPETCEAT